MATLSNVFLIFFSLTKQGLSLGSNFENFKCECSRYVEFLPVTSVTISGHLCWPVSVIFLGGFDHCCHATFTFNMCPKTGKIEIKSSSKINPKNLIWSTQKSTSGSARTRKWFLTQRKQKWNFRVFCIDHRPKLWRHKCCPGLLG